MTPFEEGGWPVQLVLLCSLVTYPLAIVAVIVAFRSKRRGVVLGLSSAALLFALTIAAVGVGGYFFQLSVLDRALVGIEPAVRDQLRARGAEEVSWDLICGALGCAIPLLLAIAGLVRGLRLREAARAPL